MAGSPNGEQQTVAGVTAQHVHLEGRVTGLERDMQNMSQAVSALTDTVQAGFAETRDMMAVASRRQDERTSEIHHRLDKQAERGRWNPGLTVAAITCAVLVGGIFVAFVQMTTSPLAKDDRETRQHVEQLRETVSILYEQRYGHADQVGYMRARVEALEIAQQAARP